MNKVILMGRLTREPEADFIPCVALGKSGEFAEKYFRKGQLVAVTGRLQVRSWDKDGERRYTTEVIIEEQHFAESKAAQEKAAEQSKPAAQTGEQMGLAEQKGFYPSEPQVAAQSKPADGFYPIDESVEDDDLPF